MGKKGKKGKKGSEVQEEEIPEEFKDLTEAQLREKMEGFEARLGKAAKERNYMALEKDLVSRFYDITRNEVRQTEAEILNHEKKMELLEQDHRVQIKVHEQKVASLEYEHKLTTQDIDKKVEETIQGNDDEHLQRLDHFHKEKEELRKNLEQKRLDHEADIKMLMLGCAKNLSKLRATFEQNHQELIRTYEEQMDQLLQDLDLRRRVEAQEIEERKNQHINELLCNHQEAFEQIKSYYRDITSDNLQLINSLKTEISEMRGREKANQKRMYQLTVENKQLTEPLTQKLELRSKLLDQLKTYKKIKTVLKNLKANSKQLTDKIKVSKSDHRHTLDRLKKMERERDDLKRRFQNGVKEIQKKADLRNLALEKKLEMLTYNAGEKQTQLKEVLAAPQLDPQVVSNVTGRLEQVLAGKNRMIKDLQYQVHQASKIYNDTIRVYERQLKELGIPPEELSFELIPTATSSMPVKGLSTKPAA